jgi:hypothetical protein
MVAPAAPTALNSLAEVQAEYWATLADHFGSESRAYLYLQQISMVADLWDHLHDGDAIDRPAGEEALAAAVLDWPLLPWHARMNDVLRECRDAWLRDPVGLGSRLIYILPALTLYSLTHPPGEAAETEREHLRARLIGLMRRDLELQHARKAGY